MIVDDRWLVGGWFQPLWKIWVHQLGWWHSQLNGKIKVMFEATKQIETNPPTISESESIPRICDDLCAVPNKNPNVSFWSSHFFWETYDIWTPRRFFQFFPTLFLHRPTHWNVSLKCNVAQTWIGSASAVPESTLAISDHACGFQSEKKYGILWLSYGWNIFKPGASTWKLVHFCCFRLKYPWGIKHGNWKSTQNWSFNRKLSYKWCIFHCNVRLPEGRSHEIP